jgi:hypothetical protein
MRSKHQLPTAVAPISNYNYHDALSPFFTNNGTSTRSKVATWTEYWQNRADYVLTAKLNEAKMKS